MSSSSVGSQAVVAVGVLMLVFAPIASSQSDLAISTEYSGFNGFTVTTITPPPPTSSGGSITQTRTKTLNLRGHNRGPVTVVDGFVELIAANDVSVRTTATTSPGCSLTNAGPPLNGVRWVLGVMPSGASRTCVVTLTAVPSVVYAGGLLRARIGSITNVDTDTTNDLGTPYLVYVSPEDYIRDMALSIQSPNEILVPGRIYEVDFTLANLGPGVEGNPNFTQSIYSETYLVGPGSGEFFALAWDGDPDCRYFVTDIGSGTFARTSEIVFGPLAPGQTRTCTMLLAVFLGGRGVRRLPFWNWAETPGTFDSRLDNNIAALVLHFEPSAIPSTTRGALLVLILGFAVIGLRRLAGAT